MALKLYSTFQSSASGFPHHREESLESDDYASGLSSKTRVSPLSSRLDSRIIKLSYDADFPFASHFISSFSSSL
jgi:hypothetical protein